MAIVGSAYVEIHTVTKSVSEEIRTSLRDAINGQGSETGKRFGDDFRSTVKDSVGKTADESSKTLSDRFTQAGDASGQGFASRFRSAVAGLAQSISSGLKIDADTSQIDAKIARVQSKLAQLRAEKANPKVDADIAVAESNLARLRAQLADLNKMEANPEVELEIGATEARIRQVESQLSRLNAQKANPRVDADIALAMAELTALNAELHKIDGKKVNFSIGDSGSIRNAINSAALLARSLRMIVLPVAILTASPYIASLAGALLELAGAAALVPAALGAIGLALGSIKIGFGGIGDALKGLSADQNKASSVAGSAAKSQAAAAKQIEAAQNRLADATRSADRTSVAGAQQVADARERLADVQRQASERIADAQQSLARTVESANRSQQQSQERVADAEQSLADARIRAAERVEDAQENLADALEAQSRQQERSQRSLADAERTLADARERAADQVASAQRSLSDAVASASRSQESALARVEDAQDALTRSQERARDAQTALTQAFADAQEQAQQLAFSLRGGALAQEDAADRLQGAQQALAEAQASGAGAEEIDDLDRAVRQAQLSLDEAADRYKDLQAESEKAAAAGIDGSKTVTDAQKNLADATKAVSDAEKNVADTRADAAQSAVDASRRIEDAQIALTKAQTTSARAIADAEQGLADARVEAARSAEDSAKRVGEANENVAKAQLQQQRDIADGEKSLARARADAAQQAVDSQRSIEEASANVTKAQQEGARDVARAQQELSRTIVSTNQANEDAARSVAEAQKAIGDASAAAADQTAASSSKAQEAMQGMAPAAIALVAALWGQKAAWDAVKMDVQQRMLDGIAGRVTTLAGNYLPILGDALGTVADGFNHAARESLDFLNQASTVGDIRTALDLVAQGVSNAYQAMPPLVRAFTDLFAVGATFMPRFGQAIADAAERFAAFIDRARETGQLAVWIENAISVIKALGTIVGNVFGIFMALINASNEAGLGALGTLVTLTATVRDFLSSGVGHDALVVLFQTIDGVLKALLPGLKAVGVALAQAIIALGPALPPVAAAFSAVAIALAPLLVDLARMAAVILPPLAALLTLIAPALGPIVAGFLAMKAVSEVAAILNTVRGALIAFNVAQGAMGIVAASSAGPMALLSGAVRAVGLAIAANPIGIAVLALAALAAAVIYCYNHFEGFRNVVDGAFRGVVAIVQTVVNFFTGPFKDGIVGAFNAVVDFIRNFPENVVKVLSALPGQIAYALGFLAGLLGRLAIDGGTAFLNGIVTAFDATVSFFRELPGRVVATLITLGVTLYTQAINAGTSFLSGITTGFNATMQFFRDLPGNIANFFTNAPTWLYETGANILNGLVGGLESGWNAVWSWLTGLVDSFIQGVKDGFGISSPSTIFMEIGVNILQGLIDGLQSLVQMVLGFITTFVQNFIAGFNVLLTFWGATWDQVQAISEAVWDAIVTFLTAGVTSFVATFQTIFGAIGVFWDFTWNAIKTTATTIWNAISTFYSTAFNAYQTLFSTVFNAVSALWTTIWTAIRTFGEAIWNALVAFYDSGFTDWRGLFTAVMNAVNTLWTTVWNAIKSFGETVWNAIKAFFDTAFAAYRTMIETVMNAISAFWSAIWNAIRATAETIWNAIKAFFDAGLNAFRALIDTVMNAISAIWTAVWNAIKATGETIWNAWNTFITGGINTFKTFWENTWNNIRDTFGRVFGGIKDIATQIWNDVKGIFRTGLNAVIGGVNWPIDKINGLFSINIAKIPEVQLATGGNIAGKVNGIGGRTADRVPAALSYDEHVWSAREVDGAGGHAGVRRLREMARAGVLQGLAEGGQATQRIVPEVNPGAFVVQPRVAEPAKHFLDALNAGQAEAVSATGGPFARMPGFAAGGALAGAQNVAKSMAGKPYIWGGAGAGGTDCSGLWGMIVRGARGEPNPYRRIGTTASMPWPGFTGGLSSSLAVGVNSHHMAGTLAGVNAEARQTGTPIMYGGGATGANSPSFPRKYSLPEIGGGFAPGAEGGGGFFDPAAWFDSLAGGLKSLAENTIRVLTPDRPEFMEQMGVSLFGKAWEGLRKTAISLIQSITGTGAAGVPAATGPVQDQVRAVARQYGWDAGAQWDAINWIVNKESSWNPNAANRTSSARGLFQKMTSLHGPIEPTAGGQAQWGLNYIKTRYGSPIAAQSHWQRLGSYDKGGWLKPGITQAINGTGKPEAIIADPMTTFERSFKNVFRYLAPNLSTAITKSIDSLDEVVARTGGEEKFERAARKAYASMPRWAQILVDQKFPQITEAIKSPQLDLVTAIQDTFTPATTPVTPPAVPVVTLPPEVAPVLKPDLPVGEIRASFEDALSRFAPELSLSVKAGAASGIREYGGQVLGNQDRLQSIADAMGSPLADVKGMVAKLVSSAREVIAQPPPVPAPQMPPIVSKPGWLETQVARLRDFALKNITKGNSAGDRLEDLGDIDYRLVRTFEKAFPNIETATETSRIDVNRTLADSAGRILDFVKQLAPDDAVNLLNALDGQNRSLDDYLRALQAEQAAGATSNTKSTTMTIADGAFQVQINGNADSVTVAQLQTTLQDWGEEILHQYEGRT